MKELAARMLRRLAGGRGRPHHPPANKLDCRATYASVVRELEAAHGAERAMTLAVGGHFEGMGRLELETLNYFGLRPRDYVIDVGCGSGRLAKPLSGYLTGRYLGIDIVPELLDPARRVAGRAGWRFELADGFTIPERDDAADVVCFFSVFTHLLHEHSFLYLTEAKRVLKPGGTVVFSFLDFTVPVHWAVFQDAVADVGVDAQHLNTFMSKDGLAVWADRLAMDLEAIHDGHVAYVPLAEPIAFDDGKVTGSMGTIGQSVCVLRKRPGDAARPPGQA